jgi:hypothetical protein
MAIIESAYSNEVSATPVEAGGVVLLSETMPGNRYDHGAVTIGDGIHIMGGHNGVNLISTHTRFDPATLTFSSKVDLDFLSAQGPVWVEISGEWYMMRGSNFRRYNPGADSWTILDNYPQSLDYWICAGVYNGEAYFASFFTAQIYAVDPTRSPGSQWRSVPSDTNLRAQYTLGHQVGNSVIMAGGRRSSANPGAQVSSMNMATATLHAAAADNMPVALRKHASVQIDGKIYTFGGELTESAQSVPYVFELDLNRSTGSQWVQLDDLPIDVAGAAAAVYNGKAYIFGGRTGQTFSGSVARNEIMVFTP